MTEIINVGAIADFGFMSPFDIRIANNLNRSKNRETRKANICLFSADVFVSAGHKFTRRDTFRWLWWSWLVWTCLLWFGEGRVRSHRLTSKSQKIAGQWGVCADSWWALCALDMVSLAGFWLKHPNDECPSNWDWAYRGSYFIWNFAQIPKLLTGYFIFFFFTVPRITLALQGLWERSQLYK